MAQRRDRPEQRRGEDTPRAEDQRPERVPLHEQRDIMTAPRQDGYVRRWVNEMDRFGPRIPRFQLAGWRPVTENLPIGHEAVVANDATLGTVLRKHVGNDRYAILMEIREEYYNEDQLKKGYINDKYEEGIKHKLDGSRENVYGESKTSVTTGKQQGHKF